MSWVNRLEPEKCAKTFGASRSVHVDGRLIVSGQELHDGRVARARRTLLLVRFFYSDHFNFVSYHLKLKAFSVEFLVIAAQHLEGFL